MFGYLAAPMSTLRAEGLAYIGAGKKRETQHLLLIDKEFSYSKFLPIGESLFVSAPGVQ